MRTRWTAEALSELDRMLSFIAAEDIGAASLIAERVLKAEETILQFPMAGRYDAQTDTFDRYIPKTSIVLTYAVRDNTIWVVTIWHTSRNPETKPKRR